MASDQQPRIIPAQLSFLALYNPSLGKTDENFRDQIVYYHSRSNYGKRSKDRRDHQEDENEKLRQIGLAQGMVNFARSFADKDNVDSVETEKSRVVLLELETEWFILASVDLTQLPSSSSTNSINEDGTEEKPQVEYSSREVTPPALLRQQLIRAHRIFLLHHGQTLDELFSRMGRTKFCNILEKFWTRFALSWDVLLHGSPAVESYDGIKLSAGGELGIGVGEEEWGSGEREVIEGFASRTEGLVDVIVSRFGEPSSVQAEKTTKLGKRDEEDEVEPWMGVGRDPSAADGVVFGGVGALSRSSLRDVSQWVEWIYGYGEFAYGVKDNPSSDRRRRKKKWPKESADHGKDEKSHGVATRRKAHSEEAVQQTADGSHRIGIPPPIVKAADASLSTASKSADTHEAEGVNASGHTRGASSVTDPDVWMKLLTFGYKGWNGGNSQPQSRPSEEVNQSKKAPSSNTAAQDADQTQEALMQYLDPMPDVDQSEERMKLRIQQENSGYFLIGLKGDMENEEAAKEEDMDEDDWNSRIFFRTLCVETTHDNNINPGTPGTFGEQSDYEKFVFDSNNKGSRGRPRMRVVVYIHRPFIYTFLFDPRAPSLTLATFYHNLHTYFSPLHKPLSLSTDPSRVADRIASASHPYTTTASTPAPPAPPLASSNNSNNTMPIYDLVYDPQTLTIHSSIPNIPEPGCYSHISGYSQSAGMGQGNWNRVESLNVHAAICDTIRATRPGDGISGGDKERTSKTSRGWWLVWMRLPASSSSASSLPHNDSDDTNDTIERKKEDSLSIASREAINPEAADQQRQSQNQTTTREAFLIRRSKESSSSSSHNRGSSSMSGTTGNRVTSSGLWRMGLGLGIGGLGGGGTTNSRMGGREASWGPRGGVEGIGFDARRYVEGLLSLNR